MWNVKDINFSKLENLEKKLNFSREFLQILLARGLDTPLKIQKFLNPKISFLHNPFLLHDMRQAVLRVRQAIENNENVFIYGDKDVDGQTSVSLLLNILKDYNLEADFYIPVDEGYGVHKEILPTLLEKDIDLFITVDCGVTNKEEIEFIKDNGIDVIILDHHEPLDTLPNADAVVDPKIQTQESEYPFYHLAGCGVVFKFGLALYQSFSPYFDKEIVVLDLETTGLNPKVDSIIEIGAVKLKNGVKIEIFERLINPGMEISEHITNITGITNNDITGAPFLEDARDDLKKFALGAEILVFHNADFDMGFLKKSSLKNIFNEKKFQILDTMRIAKNLYSYNSNSLSNLCVELGIENKNSHRALPDALRTAELFWGMIMSRDHGIRHYFEKYLDLTALGTIADVMPIISENRFIVKYGLEMLRGTNSKGLQVLQKSLFKEDKKDLNVKDISWGIAPIINSAGRMGLPNKGVELICSTKEESAILLRGEILNLNKKRKDIQAEGIKLCKILLKKDEALDEKSLIFIASASINKAVAGIIASNLVREYNRPALVLAIDGAEVTGSIRAKGGVDVVEWFDKCKNLLLRYGGHKLAGGVTLKSEKVKQFEKKISKIVANDLKNNNFEEIIDIDLELTQEDVTNEFLKEVFLLQPFGHGNAHPNILLKNVVVNNVSWMGDAKNHLRASLRVKDGYVDIIGWNKEKYKQVFDSNKTLNLIVNIEKNYYNSKESIRFSLVELECVN
ncbi:single-stranded-DNA-specific exonuclease RecJ [bacterium]